MIDQSTRSPYRGRRKGPIDPTIDPIAILESLGLRGPRIVIPVTGGADMAIWRIEHNGRSYALRLFRAEQTAAARREAAAMLTATEHDLPAPAIRAEDIWRNRPVMLLDWMAGRPLRDELRVRPWRAWRLGNAFGRMQARLHQLAAPAALLDPPTAWIDWAAPDSALRDRLLAVASENATLLHLDYHPLNVLVTGEQVTAILDWTNARAGDPRADLARTASLLRFAPFGDGPLAIIVRRTLEAGWHHGYREFAGPIHGMAPFYAWTGTLMVRDLSPRLGRPDLPWLTPELLAQVREWTIHWRQRMEQSRPNASVAAWEQEGMDRDEL